MKETWIMQVEQLKEWMNSLERDKKEIVIGEIKDILAQAKAREEF